ncbi:MAG: haloalkane dehalogenase [Promethearchaeota archaeon]
MVKLNNDTSKLLKSFPKDGFIEGESPAQIPNWKLIDFPNRPNCVESEEGIQIFTTKDGIKYIRTPEERFEGLKDFPFKPHYAFIDGLQMHYIDEGEENGQIILMLHGQPSWSYLYRKMIPLLANAGFRVIAPDHIGMGRSDKPIALSFHTYESHIIRMKNFIESLKLNNITLFCQDWGGLMGLRIVGENPEIFARVIAANTRLPIIPKGMNPFRIPNPIKIDCSLESTNFKDFVIRYAKSNEVRPRKVSALAHLKFFQQFILYTLTHPDLKPSQILQYLTLIELSPEELAAYDAPFPSLTYKAAIRTFPSMIAAVEENNVMTWKRLGSFNKPFLFLGGEYDRNMGSLEMLNMFKNHIPGAKRQPHQRYPNAGHFIQEDIGAELTNKVLSFIEANPLN